MAEIEAVEVHNFRSIVDSGKIPLNSGTTILVGPNEAGKTNFLHALKKFEEGAEFEPHDYSFYKSSNENPSESMISIYFKDVDLELLQSLSTQPNEGEFLDGLTDNICITKSYGGSYTVEYENHGERVNDFLAIRSDELESRLDNVKDAERRIFQAIRREGMDLSRPYLRLAHNDNESEISQDSVQSAIERIDNFSEQLEEFDEEVPGDLRQAVNAVERGLRRINVQSRSPGEVFVKDYFNQIYKEGASFVQAEVDIAELNSSENFYSHLLDYADISVSEPPQLFPLDAKARFDKKTAATTELSEQFSEHWSGISSSDAEIEETEQCPMEFSLDFSGGTVSLHIQDQSGSTDLVSHRSRGFRHFLSFFMRLLSKNSEMDNNLILLDNPGIHLHPGAQKDLRRAITQLSEENQVVFSTHSPFMIEHEDITEIRVVDQSQDHAEIPEDDPDDELSVGTTISTLDEATETHGQVDVLSPVRTSIGATFAQSLFAGSSNILVEGPTDKLYLEAMASQFDLVDERATIPYSTNILDFDGTKASFLIKILEAEDFDYVVLLDSDRGAAGVRRSLEKASVDDSAIVEISDVLGEGSEGTKATIEDLFDSERYCDALVDVHQDVVHEDISPIISQNGSIIKNLSDILSRMADEGQISDSEIPKGKIAERLTSEIRENGFQEADISESTRDNFDRLIDELTTNI